MITGPADTQRWARPSLRRTPPDLPRPGSPQRGEPVAPPGGKGRSGRLAGRPGAPGPAGAGDPGGAPLSATGALILVDAAAAFGLRRVFSTWGWFWPVIGTIVAVHAVSFVVRRRGWRWPAGAAAGLVTIVLMVSWTVFGSTTRAGLPLGGTWSHMARAWGDLGNQFASTVAPVTPNRSFLLLAAAGGGLLAVLSDALVFRLRSLLTGLLPAVGVLIACCAGGQGGGRWLSAPLLVAAAGCLLAVESRRTTLGSIWFGGVRPRRPAGPAALVATAAVVAALVTGPLTSRPDGSGPLGWRSVSGPGAGGERIVPNPLVDLQTRILHESNTPVFRVSAIHPSYWRLTSLDQFDGNTWTSTGSYRSFGTRLPGVGPTAPGLSAERATFDIQKLDSVWLPDQYHPVAVTGARHVSYDPQSNSLLTSSPTSNGQVYTVTSYRVLATLDPAELEAAPYPGGPVTAANTQLPASVQGPVAELAGQITSGLPDDYRKAMAIQNFLRSAPFRYTTNVGSSDSTNALAQFLFVTHAGYCQQFAGAFAVLARAAGIPTRLAVGFDQGQALAGGGFQVYDRDAHTWPEVWFGNRLGWVPFEPTPSFSNPSSQTYAGPGGAAVAPPTSLGPSAPTTVPAPATSTPPETAPGHRAHPPLTAPEPTGNRLAISHHSGSSSQWWLWPVGIVAAGLAWPVALAALRWQRRERRRREAGRRGPAAVVLNAWSEVAASLETYGVRARGSETDDELALRADAVLGARVGQGSLVELAGMARVALFGAEVPAGDADRATNLADRLAGQITDALGWSRRLRAAVLPAAGRGKERRAPA